MVFPFGMVHRHFKQSRYGLHGKLKNFWRQGFTPRRNRLDKIGNAGCNSNVCFPVPLLTHSRTFTLKSLPNPWSDCHSQASLQAAKSAFYGKIWLDLKIGRATRADCKQSAKSFFFPNPNGLGGLFNAPLPDFWNGGAA